MGLKAYVVRKVLDWIKEDLTAQVINELDGVENYSQSVASFMDEVQHTSEKLTPWTVMVLDSVKVVGFDFEMKGVHYNNVEYNEKIEGTDFKVFLNKLKDFAPENPPKGYLTVDFRVWYEYNGKRNLEVARFLDISNTRLYDYDVVTKAMEQVYKFAEKHPELLVWSE